MTGAARPVPVTHCLFFRYRLQDFKEGPKDPISMQGMMVIIQQELAMGEVIRFASRSERERIRLISEARAIYDSIFPPADPAGEQRNEAPATHRVGGVNAQRGEGASS